MKANVLKILLFTACACAFFACNVEPPKVDETDTLQKCQDTLRLQLEEFINSHDFDTICVNEQWRYSVQNDIDGILLGNVLAGFLNQNIHYDTILTSVLFYKSEYDDSKDLQVVKMQFPIFSPDVKFEDVLFPKSGDYLITDFYPGYCVVDFYMPKGQNLLTEGIYSITADDYPYRIIRSKNYDRDISCIYCMPLVQDHKAFSMDYDQYHSFTEAFMKFDIVDGKYNLQFWLNIENMLYLYCYLEDGREKNIPDEIYDIPGLMIMQKGYEYSISNNK